MNNDFLISMGISLVLQALKSSVKNEKSKAKLKAAMLKVFNAIKSLYGDDSDFA